MARMFVIGKLATLVVFAMANGAVLAAPADVPPLALPTDKTSEVVTTLLGEVGRSDMDGREFLTVQVEQPVGPHACRSAVLRADPAELGDAEQRLRIERAALSAMLEEHAVNITVSLDASHCVDGKPSFTDIRPFSADTTQR